MKKKNDKFFGNCVLWKNGEEEKYRRKVEGKNYEPKKIREEKAYKRRKEEEEERFQRRLSRKVWMDR